MMTSTKKCWGVGTITVRWFEQSLIFPIMLLLLDDFERHYLSLSAVNQNNLIALKWLAFSEAICTIPGYALVFTHLRLLPSG